MKRNILPQLRTGLQVVLTCSFLLAGGAGLTSCSEKIGEEEEVEPEAPQDWTEKVTDIYEHASIEPQTVSTVNQLAILTSVCASIDGAGPISVTPCLLNGEAVTLVTLGGTQQIEGQATGLQESQKAAFGQTNDYLKAVAGLFADGTVPADKPVLVTGISLGGMIAQQLAGVEEVLASHKIRAVISYGSPITLPLDRHGIRVVRFVDVHDKVPQMGESLLRSGMITGQDMTKAQLTELLGELDRKERVEETSQYSGMLDTHSLSYISEPCWEAYDILGNRIGEGKTPENVLELQQKLTFYPAPRL